MKAHDDPNQGKEPEEQQQTPASKLPERKPPPEPESTEFPDIEYVDEEE
jgi:hypothetical protein